MESADGDIGKRIPIARSTNLPVALQALRDYIVKAGGFVTQGEILEILSDALLVAFKLAGPMLIVSIGIGLVVAIFQAATQIHEQTLTFVPKVVVIALMLLFMGSWMIAVLSEFMQRLFLVMTNL